MQSYTQAVGASWTGQPGDAGSDPTPPNFLLLLTFVHFTQQQSGSMGHCHHLPLLMGWGQVLGPAGKVAHPFGGSIRAQCGAPHCLSQPSGLGAHQWLLDFSIAQPDPCQSFGHSFTQGSSSSLGKLPDGFLNPFKALKGFAAAQDAPCQLEPGAGWWEAAEPLSWLMFPQRARTLPSSLIPPIRA